MPAPLIERDYVLGDKGDDVLLFKQRIQYLGYFQQGASLSASVTEITMERVNRLLGDNGLEPVDVITKQIQEMIYTRDDWAIIPTPTPAPTPLPFLAPGGVPPLPTLDAEGFLPTDGDPYIYQDVDDGLWYYISRDLFINIRRYNDQNDRNIWFEAEIKTRGAETLQSYLTDTRYTYRHPVEIAQENNAVLAFTDDFFAKRPYGVVIRDGVVYRDKIRATARTYPLGDTMAVFGDGSMRVFDFGEYSADEYLEMGAEHVISFGPWLVKDGELNPRVLTETYMHYHEPRAALGMIAPGFYVVVVVDGRYDAARGAYFSWLARRMYAMGAVEALNLDGGGTTALVFLGTQLSRVSAGKPDGTNTRRVSSMLGFGTLDTDPN